MSEKLVTRLTIALSSATILISVIAIVIAIAKRVG